jgi:Protein of unknown function (DUF2510)
VAFSAVQEGVVVGLAHTVSDIILRLEKTLGVGGTGLTFLFCLALAAIVILLLAANHHSRRKGIRVAHAGSYAAPDPYYMQSFHLHRSPKIEPAPEVVSHGPARDSSNPRFRPEVDMLPVPDPAFPSLEEVRKTAALQSSLFSTVDPAMPKGPTSPEWAKSQESRVATQNGLAPMAGWYEDPDGTPGGLRYWDGSTWTERRPA